MSSLVSGDPIALNIKNQSVEALVAELAEATGESKTETIRQALERRRAELARTGRNTDRRATALRCLENEMWSLVPASEPGRRLTRNEEDEILGYGPEGV